MNTTRDPAEATGTTLLAMVALVTATGFWGGNQIVGRWISSDIPPITFSWFRWSIACLPLLLVAGWRVPAQWEKVKANWKLLFALAITGMVGFHTMLYFALSETTAINVGLFNALIPAVILIVGWATFGDRPTGRQAMGIVMSLAGAVAIISQGSLSVLMQFDVNRGDLIGVAAMFFWALYTLLLKRLPRDLDPWVVLLSTGLITWAILTPAAFWETGGLGPWAGWRPELSLRTILPVLYVGFGASFVAFACFNHGVSVIGPQRAGPFLNLIPVFAVVLAVTLLGEVVHIHHIVGCGLVLIGLWLASRSGVAVDRRLRGTP